MTVVRYLGIYVVSSEYLNVHCITLNVAFYRAANAMFGKVGRAASQKYLNGN